MKTIYKYVIPFMEIASVNLPVGAHIIRIDGVEGQLYMWAVVDTEAPLETRTFHLFKTGAAMPDNINEYFYHGCGAIFIQMELMLYVFENVHVVGNPIKLAQFGDPSYWRFPTGSMQ